MRRIIRLLVSIFGIPLVAGLRMEKNVRERVHTSAGFQVSVETAAGSYLCEVEELLPYTMAALLSGEEQEALYRAAAIICRTNLVYAWQQAGRPWEMAFSQSGLTLNNESYYNLDALETAAQDTLGIVLTYEGEVIPAPFFYMSAGATRDGGAPYLAGVTCEENLYHEDYLHTYFFEKKEMDESYTQLEFTRDADNYVTSVINTTTGENIEVQALCDTLGLASPSFTWEENDTGITVRTKGVGHGYGFDVCYGAALAESGMEYQALLEYFYQNTQLDKQYFTE